jgi:hypothetical protein
MYMYLGVIFVGKPYRIDIQRYAMEVNGYPNAPGMKIEREGSGENSLSGWKASFAVNHLLKDSPLARTSREIF